VNGAGEQPRADEAALSDRHVRRDLGDARIRRPYGERPERAPTDDLFWLCEGSTGAYILAASAAPGGAVSTLFDSTGSYRFLRQLHADANSKYLVFQEGEGGVTAFDTTNLAAPPLRYQVGENCTYIAADTRHIYCRTQNSIQRVSVTSPSGTGFTRLISNIGYGNDFALDGPVTNRIVYPAGGSGGWVHTITVSNTAPTSLATSQHYPHDATIYGGNAYWLRDEGLTYAPAAGGGSLNFMQQRVGIQSYHFDPQGNIYFRLANQQGNTVSIEKVQTSTTSTRLRRGLVVPGDMTLDDQYLYWIANYGGAVYRTLKE